MADTTEAAEVAETAETTAETTEQTTTVETTADNGDGSTTTTETTETTAEEGDKGDKPSIPDNWRDLAADGDDDTLKLLKRYGSIKGVAKALREANEKIRSGKPSASDEPMPDDAEKAKTWRKERGIPDDPTGYTLPESVTKRVSDVDKPMLTSFTEYAHAKGAPQAVVDIASEWYFDNMESIQAERISADKEASSTAEEDLRKDWGVEYKGNLQLAARFVESVPGIGANWAEARMPDGTRLGDNPAFMSWASDMGRNEFGDPVFASTDSERQHNDRKAEIEKVMKTDINRYYAEGLDKEMLEINEREAKRKR